MPGNLLELQSAQQLLTSIFAEAKRVSRPLRRKIEAKLQEVENEEQNETAEIILRELSGLIAAEYAIGVSERKAFAFRMAFENLKHYIEDPKRRRWIEMSSAWAISPEKATILNTWIPEIYEERQRLRELAQRENKIKFRGQNWILKHQPWNNPDRHR